MKEPTIKDVAKLAGVSIGTVSRVINGADNVKKQNLDKILQAIDELNFRPNQYAKGLKSNRSNIIGIIVPNLQDEFYVNLINQIELILTPEGYMSVFLSSNDSTDLECQYINFLWDKRVDAIIITSTGQNEDLLHKIQQSGTPVIFVDRNPHHFGFDSIYADKCLAAELATAHLIQKGHQKIALVTGSKQLLTNVARFNGYVKTMYDHQLPINNDFIWFGEFSQKCGFEFIEWYIRQTPENRPTAVIAGSSVITYGCLLAAKQYGIKIPEDLSLISYGNIVYSRLITPQLTYIQQMVAEIAKATTQLLIDKLNDPGSYPRKIILKPQLVVHDSVRDITHELSDLI